MHKFIYLIEVAHRRRMMREQARKKEGAREGQRDQTRGKGMEGATRRNKKEGNRQTRKEGRKGGGDEL